ncbi:MAG: hypothetical protein V3S98_04905 [Dehalococcoidia bacterium]
MTDILKAIRREKGPLLATVIRGGQLRLVIAHKQEVLWHTVLPLNPVYLEGGMIAQPRAVATSLRSVLDQSPFPRVTESVAALPGYHTLSAVVDIPDSKEFRADQVLPREARRLFSYRPDSSLLTWWPLKGADGGTRRYVLVVTRRAAVQALREVFTIAGLRLSAIDSGPMATARAANAEEGIVVQAESDGGDVVVVKNGAIGLIRSAYWGGDIIDQESLLARVTDLVERSVAAHNDANPSGPLSAQAPVLVAGAGAELLGDRVAEAMGRKPGRFQPPLVMQEGVSAAEVAANLGMVLGSGR